MSGQFISACCHGLMSFILLSYETLTLGMVISNTGVKGFSVLERIITPKSWVALHRQQSIFTSITSCDLNSIP